VENLFRAAYPQATEDQVARERLDFVAPPLIVGVVSRAASHPKIPEWEQVLSAGAACMNLVHAAHALGFGANWTTGFAAYERRCLDALGLAPHEKIAGFVHIGTPKAAREERERPALDKIVTRL
jgi:nitroreductase